MSLDISYQAALLQRDVGLALYSKTKDLAIQQTSQMISDFMQTQAAAAPHPTAGKHVDIQI